MGLIKDWIMTLLGLGRLGSRVKDLEDGQDANYKKIDERLDERNKELHDKFLSLEKSQEYLRGRFDQAEKERQIRGE